MDVLDTLPKPLIKGIEKFYDQGNYYCFVAMYILPTQLFDFVNNSSKNYSFLKTDQNFHTQKYCYHYQCDYAPPVDMCNVLMPENFHCHNPNLTTKQSSVGLVRKMTGLIILDCNRIYHYN